MINAISVFRSGPTDLSNIRVMTIIESSVEAPLNAIDVNVNAQNVCDLNTVCSYGFFTPHPDPNMLKLNEMARRQQG